MVASGESAPPTSRLAPKSIVQYNTQWHAVHEVRSTNAVSVTAPAGRRYWRLWAVAEPLPRPSFQARLVGGLSHNPQATATIRHTLVHLAPTNRPMCVAER